MSAHDLIMQIGRAARDRMRQLRELQELSHMETRDFGDLALSRSELTTIAGGAADARDRLERTAKKLGVSPTHINRERWRAIDMAKACANCEERKRCRDWQAGNGQQEDYCDFCPNAEAFAELNTEGKPN